MKTAEQALAEGRLEEAFEIAASPDLAGQRRARELLRAVGDALLRRGQEHILSRRFAEALADFDLAAKCFDDGKKVEEWRQRARTALREEQAAHHQREAALAIARERLNAGRLAEASDILAGLPAGDADVASFLDAVARRTQQATDALCHAKQSFKQGEISAAVERLLAARALHSKLDGIVEMEAKIVEEAVEQALESFRNGRPNRAEQGLALLGDVGRTHPKRIDLQEALRLARESAKALADDRYARAAVLLGRLSQVGPKADWIGDVRKHLVALEEHRRALLEGPLGLLSGGEVRSVVSAGPAVVGDTVQALERPAAMRVPPLAGPAKLHGDIVDAAGQAVGVLPRRLLLRIDGVGSFVLVRGDRISFGRAGPGASADVQLISDLAERQAEIIRAGEDYFIVSNAGVELAGLPVDYALLQHGDRIRLGKRVRFKFLRPSRKSVAAALDLEEGVRMATDCRRVILWSGPLILGGGAECHVKLSSSCGGAILMERSGGMFIRRGGPGGETMPLQVGEQIDLGELRLSIQAWSDPSITGRAAG